MLPPTTVHHRPSVLTLLPLASLLVAGCGGSAATTPAQSPTPAATTASPALASRDTATSSPARVAAAEPTAARSGPPVFGEYSSRMVVVFPLQRYAVGDSGWMTAASATGRPRAAQLDSALTQVLRDRGLESAWSLTPNTSRVAQREVINRADPRALATAGLTPGRRRNDVDLRDPIAVQLRGIVAMVPEARIVLLPLETRVQVLAGGQRQAVLRIAFIDARMATVLSFPDVTGAPAADEGAALKSVAEKFADLVIVP
ncbi:MAG TPA: hypothetical protein VE861_15405 [Gemmatimonadaceae bacterium]|nr:hypothetical protein [Gemmatimonadaceae bacterium]